MSTASFEATIQPWGNSLGLRFTRALSEVAHLERGTAVTVAVVDGGLLVKPSVKARSKRPALPYSEADLIKGMTPAKAHADELPQAIASKPEHRVARYIPDRNDIVWLDFEPTKGKEIGK